MHAPAGVVGPKGSNPFSQPPLVFILSVLKHPPPSPSPYAPLPPRSLPLSSSLHLSSYPFTLETLESHIPLSSSVFLLPPLPFLIPYASFATSRTHTIVTSVLRRLNTLFAGDGYEEIGSQCLRGESSGDLHLVPSISPSALPSFLDFLCVRARVAFWFLFVFVPSSSPTSLFLLVLRRHRPTVPTLSSLRNGN